MEETLRQLGGILLRAVPTFILVVLLHLYLKFIFFKPLERVLRERYDATEGARKLAEESIARASQKAADYEAALRVARAETYKEMEQLRRTLQDDRAANVKAARAEADAAPARSSVPEPNAAAPGEQWPYLARAGTQAYSAARCRRTRTRSASGRWCESAWK